MQYNLTRDELLDMKRILILLHAEFHNPGATRYSNPKVNLDDLTDDAVYRIDHVLECNPNVAVPTRGAPTGTVEAATHIADGAFNRLETPSDWHEEFSRWDDYRRGRI